MKDVRGTALTDRLQAAAAARKAALERFKPQPAAPAATPPPSRAEARAAELVQVRADRALAKAEKKAALEQAAEAARQGLADSEAAQLDARRGQRKERKALSKAEAKAKRDARYAARKARR